MASGGNDLPGRRRKYLRGVKRYTRRRHAQEVTRVLAWIFGAVTANAVGCVIIPASLFTLFFISQDDVSAASRLLPDRSTRF